MQTLNCKKRKYLKTLIDSSRNWDLRCYLRENLINFIAHRYPHCLPQLRAELTRSEAPELVGRHPEPIVEPERQPPV